MTITRTPDALVGKRYTNWTGRQFARVAVALDDGRWALLDVLTRESRQAVPLFAGVAEIRDAARERVARSDYGTVVGTTAELPQYCVPLPKRLQ